MSPFARFALVALAPAFAAHAQPAGLPAADTPFAAAAPVGDAALGAIAGKADVNMVVNAANRATVSDNSVSGNSVTGTISFDGAAFADMNGLSLLSANTGNNVAINSSLNVNVAIRP